ncbi:MAG: spermidine synthase, partial [Pseudomonadales bacterium]
MASLAMLQRALILLLLTVGLAKGAGAADRVIHKEKSLYSNILVTQSRDRRCLAFSVRRKKPKQTCIDLDDPDKVVFDYVRMVFASLLINPEPKRLLMIGLGGGTISTVFGKVYPGLQQDLVEIDPAVVKIAADYFAFRPGANT